jgi:hypothetical protein
MENLGGALQEQRAGRRGEANEATGVAPGWGFGGGPLRPLGEAGGVTRASDRRLPTGRNGWGACVGGKGKVGGGERKRRKERGRWGGGRPAGQAGGIQRGVAALLASARPIGTLHIGLVWALAFLLGSWFIFYPCVNFQYEMPCILSSAKISKIKFCPIYLLLLNRQGWCFGSWKRML